MGVVITALVVVRLHCHIHVEAVHRLKQSSELGLMAKFLAMRVISVSGSSHGRPVGDELSIHLVQGIIHAPHLTGLIAVMTTIAHVIDEVVDCEAECTRMGMHRESHDHSRSVTATSSENYSDEETSVQGVDESRSLTVSRDGRKVENHNDDIIADVLEAARSRWLDRHDHRALRATLLTLLLTLEREH